jgi:hypothetical protein
MADDYAPVRRTTGEDLAVETYQLMRVAEKLHDMAGADGYLHPATLIELTHQFVRLHQVADRVWQQHEVARGRPS